MLEEAGAEPEAQCSRSSARLILWVLGGWVNAGWREGRVVEVIFRMPAWFGFTQ